MQEHKLKKTYHFTGICMSDKTLTKHNCILYIVLVLIHAACICLFLLNIVIMIILPSVMDLCI